MKDSAPPAIRRLDLSPAERARTVLASLPCLTWTRDGDPLAVPFVEEVGSPMLVVNAELSEELLAARECRVELSGNALLGALRLSGEFWPVADDASLVWLRQVWAEHAGCSPDCSGRATHLVGLRVDRVELFRPGADPESVDLDAYQLAQPDLVLAHGVTLAAHLNAEHLSELVETATWLTGTPDVLATRIEWVDAAGLELTVIDRTGSRRVRYDFPSSISRPEDLFGAVHRLVQHAGAGPRTA